MTIEEAIKRCENIRDGAFAVLDSGFGTNDNENPLVYEKRVEFANICIAALRAQQERENPQPLTLEELLRMDGQPVWVTFLDDVFTIGHTAPLWMIVNAEEKEFQAKNEYVCFSDIGCIAYPSKPKGRE